MPPEPLLYSAHLFTPPSRTNRIRGVPPDVFTVTALSKVTVISMVSPSP